MDLRWALKVVLLSLLGVIALVFVMWLLAPYIAMWYFSQVLKGG